MVRVISSLFLLGNNLPAHTFASLDTAQSVTSCNHPRPNTTTTEMQLSKHPDTKQGLRFQQPGSCRAQDGNHSSLGSLRTSTTDLPELRRKTKANKITENELP